MNKNIEKSKIIIYQTEDGTTKINVRLENNSAWLNQNDIVELFQSSKPNISEHIKHIFKEGELNEEAVVRNFRTTAADDKEYNVKYYNNVLVDAGNISAELAEKKAHLEYSAYAEKSMDELTAVEKHFLQSIEAAEKKLLKKKKGD